MMRWGLALFVGLGVSTAAVAAPAVYKWVDRGGQVHYDDTNVADGQRLTRELLATRLVPPAKDAGFTVPVEWVELFARECDLARSRISTLQSATAVFGLAPSGREFQYSAQQVRLMIVETRMSETQHCPGGAAREAYRAALAEARLRREQALAHE
jgi:hypothetical protein